MPNDNRPTILVVDDSELNQALLTELLHHDYQVLRADNGADGLDLAQRSLPDLIILDIIMPMLDGYEVCRRLKEEPSTTNIPVIFITSMDSPLDIQKGFKTGAVDYITKPFKGIEVLARTKTHLALKAARESLESQNRVLKKTVAEQKINIGLARKVLDYISANPPRYIRLGEGLALCLHWFTISCQTEGGDNLFVRKLPPRKLHPRGRTIISLKDQSGHAVNCMLRNIITDLVHNILLNNHHLPLDRIITKLNKTVCSSRIFLEDQFFTTITAEIDHATLTLDFVSAGHPAFFLIRGSEVTGHPHPGEPGNNLPVGILEEVEYQPARLQLEPGDKLLFYTDGLPDMPFKQEGVSLGFYELRDLLEEMVQNQPQLPISRIIDQLIQRLAELSKVVVSATENSSGDDISLLGLEIENMRAFQEMNLTPARFPDIDSLTTACWEKIDADLQNHDYGAQKIKIRAALSEALLNAWKHGHQKDDALPITVRWRFGNDFTFEVIDQGRGFDYRNLPDPTAPENLLAESGRGLFMIQRFAQQVKWKAGGRHLLATFRASSVYQKDAGRQDQAPSLWGVALKG